MNIIIKALPILISLASCSSYTKANTSPVYDGSDISGIEKITAKLQQQVQGASHEQWRIDAQARIEKYRKSPLIIKVKDENGKPIKNANVEIKQLSHQFTFGGVVSTRLFDKQKAVLPHFINQIGFNNALKYKHKDRLSHTVQPIIEWAHRHNITTRGHVLVYPGWKYMHKEAKNFTNKPEQLSLFIDNQLKEYANQWDVVEWDVMNEPLDNFDIPNLLGRKVMAHWFNQAKKEVQNNARLLINENRIISAPPANVNRINQYKAVIKEVIADGGPIEAIGVQSRFRVDSITPEMVYQRLNVFNDFDLPIVATEFEIVNTPRYKFKATDFKRAQMTEEYMQILFSHPKVDGIIAWTILNGLTSKSSAESPRTNEKESKGILNWDMTVPLNGKVWLYLINKHWRTNESLITNQKGITNLKAFHGTYQVTVMYKGKRFTKELTLNKQPQELLFFINKSNKT